MIKQAMVLAGPKQSFSLQELVIPPLKFNQVLIKVTACGLCRTDIHILDNDIPHINYPIVPGHEIVGQIIAINESVSDFTIGDRVGVPWLFKTCGGCKFCLEGCENLCENIVFTGCNVDGGFSSHVIANSDFIVKLPDNYSDEELAPFLCAGLIGHRAISFIPENAVNIGLYGFGAASHIAIQVLLAKNKNVFAFTRPNDKIKQNFAKSLGASEAYGSDFIPETKLDASLVFASDGNVVVNALKATQRGGIVILAGIYMTDIPSFPYEIIWNEKSIRSVANLTRADMHNFIDFIKNNKIKTHVNIYRLNELNQAISDMKGGRVKGAIVIKP